MGDAALSFIQTYTGKRFDFDGLIAHEPQPICLEDIAHALSNIGRFGGHTRWFYSVAEHSWLVAAILCDATDEPWHSEHVRAALLHDAAEAYVGDLMRPLKIRDDMAQFRRLEDLAMKQIMLHFGITSRLDPCMIKIADEIALSIEMRDLMTFVDDGLLEGPRAWREGTNVPSWIQPRISEALLPPVWAKERFLALCDAAGIQG